MRSFIIFILFITSAGAFAAKDPHDPAVQSCIQRAMRTQYPRYYTGTTDYAFTVRQATSDELNFAYMIQLSPPATEPVSFIEVDDGNYFSATLQFSVQDIKQATIDIQNCLDPKN